MSSNPSPAQVFIPGGLPQATYVSRDHLGIEAQVKSWAEGAHTSMLSVSGPTKTGKTVLLKRFFRDAVWLSGGVIDSADDFWATICDELEVFTDHSLSVEGSAQQTVSGEGTVDAALIKASAGGSESQTTQKGITRSRSRSPRIAARDALQNTKSTIIVDDFHYIPSGEQQKIVRGLKDLVFEGLPVVLVAVPHRAYDAVRVEKEMTGRVDSLTIGQWDEDDLAQIARLGYAALSVAVSDQIIRTVSKESFGSPHLMQAHCLALAGAAPAGAHEIPEPEWDRFFRARAAAASKSAFDLLKQGPRQRNDRNVRRLKDGIETDIYGAVLAAIASTGPRTALQYEDIRAALRAVLDSDLPQRHEITNILDQMTRIAREKIEGEPVLEYDSEYSTLYIADPFFAYYLRWAPESLKELSVEKRQSE